MVHRFWAGTVAGTYVGHSEFFGQPNDVVWLGQGGVIAYGTASAIDEGAEIRFTAWE